MTPTIETGAIPARRAFGKKELLLAASFGFGCGLLVTLNVTDPSGPIARWADHHERMIQRDEIAPVMLPLAKAGVADAVIWYALNDHNAPLQPLRALASAGNPQAQWALAGILRYSDRAAALRLVQQAADSGLPEAVLYEACATQKRCR